MGVGRAEVEGMRPPNVVKVVETSEVNVEGVVIVVVNEVITVVGPEEGDENGLSEAPDG